MVVKALQKACEDWSPQVKFMFWKGLGIFRANLQWRGDRVADGA